MDSSEQKPAVDEAKAQEAATLQQLKREHPEGVAVEALDRTFFIRPPTDKEWQRFEGNGLSPSVEKKARCLEFLVRDCVLYPAPEPFVALLKRRPGLSNSLGEVVLELAGAGAPVVKKL